MFIPKTLQIREIFFAKPEDIEDLKSPIIASTNVKYLKSISSSEYASCSRELVKTDGMKSESLRISAMIAFPLETSFNNVCPHKLSLDKKSASVFRIFEPRCPFK